MFSVFLASIAVSVPFAQSSIAFAVVCSRFGPSTRLLESWHSILVSMIGLVFPRLGNLPWIFEEGYLDSVSQSSVLGLRLGFQNMGLDTISRKGKTSTRFLDSPTLRFVLSPWVFAMVPYYSSSHRDNSRSESPVSFLVLDFFTSTLWLYT